MVRFLEPAGSALVHSCVDFTGSCFSQENHHRLRFQMASVGWALRLVQGAPEQTNRLAYGAVHWSKSPQDQDHDGSYGRTWDRVLDEPVRSCSGDIYTISAWCFTSTSMQRACGPPVGYSWTRASKWKSENPVVGLGWLHYYWQSRVLVLLCQVRQMDDPRQLVIWIIIQGKMFMETPRAALLVPKLGLPKQSNFSALHLL